MTLRCYSPKKSNHVRAPSSKFENTKAALQGRQKLHQSQLSVCMASANQSTGAVLNVSTKTKLLADLAGVNPKRMS
jgi:hypothetical protein